MTAVMTVATMTVATTVVTGTTTTAAALLRWTGESARTISSDNVVDLLHLDGDFDVWDLSSSTLTQ
jgi:hypothetical protein